MQNKKCPVLTLSFLNKWNNQPVQWLNVAAIAIAIWHYASCCGICIAAIVIWHWQHWQQHWWLAPQCLHCYGYHCLSLVASSMCQLMSGNGKLHCGSTKYLFAKQQNNQPVVGGVDDGIQVSFFWTLHAASSPVFLFSGLPCNASVVNIYLKTTIKQALSGSCGSQFLEAGGGCIWKAVAVGIQKMVAVGICERWWHSDAGGGCIIILLFLKFEHTLCLGHPLHGSGSQVFWEWGKKQKMKATINLQEGSDGAIVLPHPEVQGGGIGSIAPPIRKCREASSIIGEGKTNKKIKKNNQPPRQWWQHGAATSRRAGMHLAFLGGKTINLLSLDCIFVFFLQQGNRMPLLPLLDALPLPPGLFCVTWNATITMAGWLYFFFCTRT